MRSPCTTAKSSSRSLQLEKARTQQRRPNAAKNKYINKLINKNKTTPKQTNKQKHDKDKTTQNIWNYKRQAKRHTANHELEESRVAIVITEKIKLEAKGIQ